MNGDIADIVLVSTADWDNPYWTNKQHVAVELNARGHRVLYVESQGLRRPTATIKDTGRIWRRLARAFTPPREVRPNLWIWSPLSVPFQGVDSVRKFNRMLIQFGLSFWVNRLRLKPGMLWTYSPLTTDFYNLSDYAFTVYHAVDDIKAQPGMPRDVIAASEKTLAEHADVVFTTAPQIQANLSPHNPDTYYLPNVADFRHFNSALDETLAVPDDLASIGRPCIGFIGAVSSYKIDLDLIAKAAKARPTWQFVFIGEIGEGDPLTTIKDYQGITNITFMGGRRYANLPSYLKGFDVAIIPSILNEYTKSMFPMKFFEYLAAGKPVVCTRLASLQEFERYVHTADSPESFVEAVESALAGEGAPLEDRLALAQQYTYAARQEKMMAIIEDKLNRKSDAA
ncbi:MAG TPA: glycosyltransferase [Caulobacteraceae bacterium]|nr:glycosyltransferase [Caulobacteraceae bacterium]